MKSFWSQITSHESKLSKTGENLIKKYCRKCSHHQKILGKFHVTLREYFGKYIELWVSCFSLITQQLTRDGFLKKQQISLKFCVSRNHANNYDNSIEKAHNTAVIKSSAFTPHLKLKTLLFAMYQLSVDVCF